MAAADDGQLVSWVNPLTGSAGTITPLRSYYLDPGTVCRDYRASVAYAEKIGRMKGSACRKVDGSWDIAGPV
jgi:surface antigen